MYKSSNKYFGFFRNLANPLKIGVILVLKEKQCSVNELARKLRIEQSKLSHALASLRKCSIVKVKRQGKKRVYYLNKDTIVPILKIIEKHEKKYCKYCWVKKK